MPTIFDSVFSSRTGLADVGVSVDPFTGKTSTHIPVIVRHPASPVVTRELFFESVRQQIIEGTADPSISQHLNDLKDVFNVGLAHYGDGYVMMVRFQSSTRYNHIFLAKSSDGISWTQIPRLLDLPELPDAPDPKGVSKSGYNIPADKKWHKGIFYDPRITQMEDGNYYIALPVDYDTLEPVGQPYKNICDNVLYRTRDFEKFEFVTTISGHTRNCVLFPRQIDGYYWCAGRPNTEKRVHTILMRSKDLKTWEHMDPIFAGGHGWLIYAGPGFPPFEAEDYWVFGVHGVETKGTYQVIYRAGVCLLDKKTMKIVGDIVPIIHPEQQYEFDGSVDDIIFQTGTLFSDGKHYGVKSRDTKVAIYYGAADTVVGVGLTTVGKLIDAALGKYNPFKVFSA